MSRVNEKQEKRPIINKDRQLPGKWSKMKELLPINSE